LDFLKKIFKNKTDSSNRKINEGDREFAKVFLENNCCFLTFPLPQGVAVEGLTQEELLRLIKDAASSVSKATEVTPLYEKKEGRTILPLFTDQKKPEAYVGDYCKKMGKVIPFGVMSIQGKKFLRAIHGADQVVLNPMCPDEKIFSRELMDYLLQGEI
jgi:hypothetical protein